jgi:chorismate synthase
MLRFLSSGESHGPQVTAFIEGLPAGLEIDLAEVQKELQRRKVGSGSGARQTMETDEVEIVSGVRAGKTIGSPITLVIKNKDNLEGMALPKMKSPRPGHADLAGAQKYGFSDLRNVLERASARETVARVAAGAVFKQFLKVLGIELAAYTVQIGSVTSEKATTFEEVKNAPLETPAMEALIEETRVQKNTLGGVIEVWAVGLPVGLGSYVQWDRKLDGQLAQALMSIPSVKAVEIGDGIAAAQEFGSEVHDAIAYEKGFQRASNRAGGLEGGVTNGEPLVLRVYLKPLATLGVPLESVDFESKETALASVERSDVCVVPRAAVIAEAMTAMVLVQNLLEKFGGDCMEDLLATLESYKKRL